MVKFYISYQRSLCDVAHICERKNNDGTYDRIYISTTGGFSTIRITNRGEYSIVNEKTDHPESGEEFIRAFVEVTDSCQRLSTSLFAGINVPVENQE
jgi:hypothetical protein